MFFHRRNQNYIKLFFSLLFRFALLWLCFTRPKTSSSLPLISVSSAAARVDDGFLCVYSFDTYSLFFFTFSVLFFFSSLQSCCLFAWLTVGMIFPVLYRAFLAALLLPFSSAHSQLIICLPRGEESCWGFLCNDSDRECNWMNGMSIDLLTQLVLSTESLCGVLHDFETCGRRRTLFFSTHNLSNTCN